MITSDFGFANQIIAYQFSFFPLTLVGILYSIFLSPFHSVFLGMVVSISLCFNTSHSFAVFFFLFLSLISTFWSALEPSSVFPLAKVSPPVISSSYMPWHAICTRYSSFQAMSSTLSTLACLLVISNLNMVKREIFLSSVICSSFSLCHSEKSLFTLSSNCSA